MRQLPRPGDRDDVVALGQQPGEGKLAGRRADLIGQGREVVQQRQVMVEGVVLKAFVAEPPPIALGHVGAAPHAAAEERIGERTVGHEGDAQLAAYGDQVRLRLAGEERILGLQGCHGVGPVGAAQLIGGRVADGEVAHLAGGHKVGHRADAVLQRHVLRDLVQIVDIDHVGVEPREALVALAFDGGRAGVDGYLARVVDVDAALAGEHDLAAAVAEDGAEEGFAAPHAVDRRAVDEVEAPVEGLVDRGDPFGLVRVEQPVGAEAELGDRQARATEGDFLQHVGVPSLHAGKRATNPHRQPTTGSTDVVVSPAPIVFAIYGMRQP